MNIQYINKDRHEVVDDKVYFFKSMEIKPVPNKLGNYLCSKYPRSFRKVNYVIQRESKSGSILEEKKENIDLKIIIYRKAKNEQKFRQLPSSQDVKYA